MQLLHRQVLFYEGIIDLLLLLLFVVCIAHLLNTTLQLNLLLVLVRDDVRNV
jgi:hypothetical protein